VAWLQVKVYLPQLLRLTESPHQSWHKICVLCKQTFKILNFCRRLAGKCITHVPTVVNINGFWKRVHLSKVFFSKKFSHFVVDVNAKLFSNMLTHIRPVHLNTSNRSGVWSRHVGLHRYVHMYVHMLYLCCTYVYVPTRYPCAATWRSGHLIRLINTWPGFESHQRVRF
jgi:hypothetical protein